MAETKDFLIRVNPDLWRKSQIHKIDTGESMNALINRLLADYFAEKTLKK